MKPITSVSIGKNLSAYFHCIHWKKGSIIIKSHRLIYLSIYQILVVGLFVPLEMVVLNLTIIKRICFPDDEETRRLFRNIDNIQKANRKSLSEIVREALFQYVEKQVRFIQAKLTELPQSESQSEKRKIDQADVEWLMQSKNWNKEQVVAYLKDIGYE